MIHAKHYRKTHAVLGMLSAFLLSCGQIAFGGWSPNPVPTGTVKCSNGQAWDHINDTRDWIPLELADGEDKDSLDCEEQSGNNLDTSATKWSCSAGEGYVSPTTGITTKWYATSTAQPAWAKATLVDYSSSPDANANDADKDTGSYTNLHGFKVGVRANFSGAWNGTSGTIWEGDADYSYSSETVQHYYANVLGNQTPREKQGEGYFYGSFEYKTEPSDASPTGDVQADLSLGCTGYWSGLMDDCDEWDESGDSISVGFSLSAYGVGGGISYGWTLVDEQEGLVAGDWAYSTNDGLGSNHAPGSTPMFAYQTGDGELTKEWEEGDSYLRSVSTKTWDQSNPVKGQFDLSTGAKVTNHCADDWVNAHMSMSSPVLTIENVTYSP